MSSNCQSLAQDAEASGAYPFGSALVSFAAAFLAARVARACNCSNARSVGRSGGSSPRSIRLSAPRARSTQRASGWASVWRSEGADGIENTLEHRLLAAAHGLVGGGL